MAEFVNRELEITELDRIAAEPSAQFVMVYGRRRVGKTTLLTTWATHSGLPTFYWVAKREARETLMANFAQRVWAWEHGIDQAKLSIRPADWEAALNTLAGAIGSRKCIAILDELPYVLESDPAFASYLQAAWDHQFKQSQVRLFLSGSHVGMMTSLLEYQAPLYGRFTAQLPIQPLTFPAIARFLPGYDVHKRLAVYAILGGIPAYLERWRSNESLVTNVERLFLQRTGWFRNEPMVLVSDLTRRETGTYESILRAIASGNHTREAISEAAVLPTTALSHYLSRLLDLQLVERRIPATVPLDRRKTSKQSQYFLRDTYLHFYHRFVDPNLHLIEQGLSRRLWASMGDNFRAFVAETFEDLSRAWVLARAEAGKLPFEPEVVGSYWASEVQVDVVAIYWKTKHILLGEAKWGAGKVGREMIRGLIEKAPKVVSEGGKGWKVHYAFFAREGFTAAARAEANQHGSLLVTLTDMERELRKASQP